MDHSRQIRMLIDSFYSIQRTRIMISNRIKMIVKDYDVEEEEASNLHEMVKIHLTEAEKNIEKRVRTFVRPLPIYKNWIEPEVKGVAELLAGGIIAGIEDISRFTYASELWTYCGLGLKAETLENGEIVHTIQKRKKGEKINYSPFLKTLCYKIGEQFIKTGNRGFYGKKYQHYKERELNKQERKGVKVLPQALLDKKPKKEKESGEYMSEGHVHNRARRKTAKLFLSHLHQVWRAMEGLPVPPPYHISHSTGTTHEYYPPPGWKAPEKWENIKSSGAS